jgi:transposase
MERSWPEAYLRLEDEYWRALPAKKENEDERKKPEGRNLLERLEICEDAAPRFITSGRVPLANNDAERLVRMLKARAKMSGCFKTFEMARGFCKMRGHIAGCKKNDMSAYESIKMLVQGQTPEFIKARLSSDVR